MAPVQKKVVIDIKIDYQSLRKLVLVLRAVNHKLRQEIIHLIESEKRMTVTEIYTRLGLEQSVASQHLAVLRRAGVVATEREGKFTLYSINQHRIAELEKLVETLVGTSDKAGFEKAGELLRAVAHKLRLKILHLISSKKEVNVKVIYNTLKAEQSIASLHLKILRGAGVVNTRREGKRIFYSLDYGKLITVQSAIELFEELT